jgi:hypothetical protein
LELFDSSLPKHPRRVSELGAWCFALILLTLGLFTLGCVSPGPSGIEYAGGDNSVTKDGLHRIIWEPFAATFVRPGARLDKYSRVIIEPLTISYKEKPSPGRIAYNSIQPNYRLPAGAHASMKKSYAKALEGQLISKGRFEAASKSGEDVLLIRGHIFDLAITAPPMVDQPADSSTVVADSGQMTLALDLIDSTSGESLLRVGDRQPIRDDRNYFVSDPVSRSGTLREIFGKWALKLLLEIDQLSALGEIPYPEG